MEGAELTSMTFPAVSLDFGRLSGWGRGETLSPGDVLVPGVSVAVVINYSVSTEM